MLDEVQTDGVEDVDEGLDAMPEETTPDQPQAAAPPSETPAAPVAPGAEQPFSLEGLTPEQVKVWKDDSENRHNWQKSNTEKAQAVADERRALEQQRNEIQQFQNDPVTKALWEARQRINAHPELLADVSRFNAEPAQGGAPQADPLVNQLFGQVQELRQQADQNRWQSEEQVRSEAALAGQKAVETFRETHEMSDEEFSTFLNEGYGPSGTIDLEDAYKAYAFDTLMAEARQGAQGEVAAVDDEKRQAASTVVPGSHTPEVHTGDRNDTNFDGARERSRSRYNLGLTKDY